MRNEIVLLVGTRPEAVKAAPVALSLAGHPDLRPIIVHSGQHPVMVEQALGAFGLCPDEWLSIKRTTGSQAELFSALLPELDQMLIRRAPAAMVVQGDTSTTLAGALAAFWRGVPVAHLEAGLRTGDLRAPFPEEGNRQLVARLAALHLAPTTAAADSLRAESVPGNEIIVTGNTVVDAVRHVAAAELPTHDPRLIMLERQLDFGGGRLMLVTVHRRESWGPRLDVILGAVSTVVDCHPDLRVLLPAHPNPAVRAQVSAALGQCQRVVVTEPLNYPDLVWALRRASLVLTDSGGLQEEAPSFGVPVLVLRDVTERMEAVAAGCARLVGTDRDRIMAECGRVLRTNVRVPMESNPFGDGYAAPRVLAALERLVGVTDTRVPDWSVLAPAS